MWRRSVLLALLAVGVLTVACDANAEEEPEGAFYLEARVTVEDLRSASGGWEGGGFPRWPTVTVMRWWNRDGGHHRHEFDREHPVLDWEPSWMVADGDELTHYDSQADTYRRYPIPSGDSGMTGYPPISTVIGPLPTGSFEEFLDQWRSRADMVEPEGTAEVAGRTVTVVRYEPTRRSSGSDRGDESAGIGRFYVDEEAGFILRHETDDGPGGQRFDAIVTLLDLSPSFSSRDFRADLPDGATEAAEAGGSCSGGSGRTSDPPGEGFFQFLSAPLQFPYAPSGWSLGQSGSQSGPGCSLVGWFSEVTRDAGDFIAIMQSPVPEQGIPAVREDAEPVDLDGIEAHRRSEGGHEYLLWEQDGTIVLIHTNAAPFEELLRIAESAQARP